MPSARHSGNRGPLDMTVISMQSLRDRCYNAVLADPADCEDQISVDVVIDDMIKKGFEGICPTDGMDDLLCESGADGKDPVEKFVQKCKVSYLNRERKTREYNGPAQQPQFDPDATRTAEDVARELAGGVPFRRQGNKAPIIGLAVAGAAFIGTLLLGKLYVDSRNYNHMVNLPTVEYTVQPGDTFYRLSERFISDKDKYEKQTITHHVMELNGAEGSSMLRPGDRILLPTEGMTPSQIAELGGR